MAANNPANNATLWMGDLEAYMDEAFIIKAFEQQGERVVSVKLIRDKGFRSVGYCFVEFKDAETARLVMLKLNGKIISDTTPPMRFKLNHASFGREHLQVQDFALFVGDLTEEVDDLKLYEAFAKRYSSLRSVKVVLDVRGKSRGYGFVHFTSEQDQQKALLEMHHCTGIGRRPIRVSFAAPKKYFSGGSTSYQDYSQTQFGYQQQSNYQSSPYYPYGNYPSYPYQNDYQSQCYNAADGSWEDYENDEELSDPGLEIDVEAENKKFMKANEELYQVLDNSRWHPLDTFLSSVAVSKR